MHGNIKAGEARRAQNIAGAAIIFSLLAGSILRAQALQSEPPGDVVIGSGSFSPIDMRGLHLAIVRELNNLFLVIFSQSPAPARGQR
jgi:hypothetical protein